MQYVFLMRNVQPPKAIAKSGLVPVRWTIHCQKEEN